MSSSGKSPGPPTSMIITFLRLFSAYRILEASLESTSMLMAGMRDRILVGEEEIKRLRSSRDSAVDDQVRSVKMISNWQALQAGSTRLPFPDVHVETQEPQQDIPVVSPDTPLGPRLARDVQRARVTESRRKAGEVRKVYEATHGGLGVNPDILGLDNV